MPSPWTTDAAVRLILEDNDAADLSTTEPYIEAAAHMVDSVCATSGYTDAVMEKITRWLAAHFCCIPLPQKVREEVSTLREVYQQQVDIGLNQTRYGQMAKLLDVKGNLAKLDENIKDGKNPGALKARATWAGTKLSCES